MHLTTVASWAAVIWRALEARGIDPHPVFAQADINPAHLHDAGARLKLSAMTRLWDLAVDVTGDPCFGTSAGQHIHPTTFHALGYAWLASDTLREALGRLVRFTRLVSTAITVRAAAVDGKVELVIEPMSGVPRVSPAAADAGLVALIALCRTSYGQTFRPLRLRLRRAALPCDKTLAEYVRAPIDYGAPDNALVLAAEDLDRPLPTGNTELARVSDEVIMRYLAKFDRADVISQVRIKLTELLPSGNTSVHHVAEAMHLSVRNLQRKLAEHGTSLAKLREETRRELASQYVHNSQLSVGEITYLLGFSEPASFTRAFHRWHGMSPSASRYAAG